MAEETFSDLGRVEAIAKLYEGTPYKPYDSCRFETSGKSCITSHSRVFIEGIDFDLVYFPLKHLGYKCVTAVTGELYAEFSHPRTLDLRLGLSSKLDFKHRMPMATRSPAAKSMDLICVSDNLGAAFMGFQILEREKRAFEQSGDVKAQPKLEEYKHLVGA